MRFFSLFLFSVLIVISYAAPRERKTQQKKIVCHYNVKSYYRHDKGKFETKHLEPVLEPCTHLVYGYYYINPQTFHLESPVPELEDLNGESYLKHVVAAKNSHPHLKVLLGVGGIFDEIYVDAYLDVLLPTNRDIFTTNVAEFLSNNSFDGIDLGWQFPSKNEELLEYEEELESLMSTEPKRGDPDAVLDPRRDFILLLQELKRKLSASRKIISVTVLPAVDVRKNYNIPEMVNYIDFVTLAAFDFNTPENSPLMADFAHPLEYIDGRNYMFCGKSRINYWLENRMSATKIVLGVPTYGRSWKMNKVPITEAIPPVIYTSNQADKGDITNKTGLISYLEICTEFRDTPITRVFAEPLTEIQTNPEYGVYAYRFPDENGNHGLWTSYENNETIAKKAEYVKNNLSGIAIFDITNDDFPASCGILYPLLRAATSILRPSAISSLLRDYKYIKHREAMAF